MDQNLCFARSYSVFGIGRDVCCTSLQRAERVVYQVRRQTLTDNGYIQETSINSSFVRERVFYYLNDRFVSNRTRDIIFSTRSLECF